jgi:hypothetical protein
MAKAKLSKLFDYRKGNGGMTSYPKGYEGEMPQAHFDAAVAAGAVEGQAAAKADTGKDGGTK